MPENKIYEARADSDGKFYVHGPNHHAFSFYGGPLSPESRLNSQEEAEKVSYLCDLAWKAGYEQCQANIKAVLGILK